MDPDGTVFDILIFVTSNFDISIQYYISYENVISKVSSIFTVIQEDVKSVASTLTLFTIDFPPYTKNLRSGFSFLFPVLSFIVYLASNPSKRDFASDVVTKKVKVFKARNVNSNVLLLLYIYIIQ
jgi:hypothetical protein